MELLWSYEIENYSDISLYDIAQQITMQVRKSKMIFFCFFDNAHHHDIQQSKDDGKII